MSNDYGHNLKHIEYNNIDKKIYDINKTSYSEFYFICEKCYHLYRKYDDNLYYSNGNKDEKLETLTCEEIIIKSIIE